VRFQLDVFFYQNGEGDEVHKHLLTRELAQINSYCKACLYTAVFSHGALTENRTKEIQATDLERWCFVFLHKTTTTNSLPEDNNKYSVHECVPQGVLQQQNKMIKTGEEFP